MITVSEFNGQKVGVFGLGKAGQAAVAALLAGGAEVFCWDDRNTPSPGRGEGGVGASPLVRNVEPAPILTLPPTGGGNARSEPIADWPWAQLSALILSPGVPLTHPAPHAVVAMARAHGCPVIGEVELLWRACPEAMFIGITGTNGKSTTTALIGHMLAEAGYDVQVGGNLGIPALALAPLDETGIYVLEMSSYQLDLCDRVRFDIAVLLNFTPDHLDRHGDMEGYIKAKTRIFRNHDEAPADEWSRGVAVVAVDDDYARAITDKLVRNPNLDLLRVSAQSRVANGVYVTQGILHDRIPESIAPLPTADFDLSAMPTLPGRHNWQNAAAAYAVARVCGVSPVEAEAAMRSFPGLRHRLQLVATVRGVRFINDSKATNADATANALAPYEAIYWIAGGKAKAGGIASLERYFPHVVHAFLIGEAEGEFAATLEGKVAYTRCGTLEVAVSKAAAMAFAAAPSLTLPPAGGGDVHVSSRGKDPVVLLSPACASFDQFKSFEQRGDQFCELVTSHWPLVTGHSGDRHAS